MKIFSTSKHNNNSRFIKELNQPLFPRYMDQLHKAVLLQTSSIVYLHTPLCWCWMYFSHAGQRRWQLHHLGVELQKCLGTKWNQNEILPHTCNI